MISSTYYKSKIDRLTNVKTQIFSSYESLESCYGYINSGKGYIEKLIIDKEPIDKGKMDDLTVLLDSCRAAYDTILTECDLKIEEYQQLYQQALYYEEMERQKALAKTKNNSMSTMSVLK